MSVGRNDAATHTLAERFPAVAFGTSGVRALVSDLSDAAVAAYVRAFLGRLSSTGRPVRTVVLASDLRPSSPSIALAACRAIYQAGYAVEYLGTVPTPALALRCLQAGVPGVMVTGSHIPFDRNGIKFYTPEGEILKEDETAISGWRGAEEDFTPPSSVENLPEVSTTARTAYVQRYVGYFGHAALRGLRVGLYEHSAVGRDLTRDILMAMGARVVSLGRSDDFVPVDTEAVCEADIARARAWCIEHGLDALVSTDGDGDRPLVFDEGGDFIRGDLLGLVCARTLGLRSLAVPLSCNTAIEKCGAFRRVLRTRIGSPYVIAGMHALAAQGESAIGGFEANGGFLLGSPLEGLGALPTRDAVLPIVTLLSRSVRQQVPISALIGALPPRYTHSDRIRDVPKDASELLLRQLTESSELLAKFFGAMGAVEYVNTTDGLRIGFSSGDIVHLRPSGNAPELRCYAESDSFYNASMLVERCLSAAKMALS